MNIHVDPVRLEYSNAACAACGYKVRGGRVTAEKGVPNFMNVVCTLRCSLDLAKERSIRIAGAWELGIGLGEIHEDRLKKAMDAHDKTFYGQCVKLRRELHACKGFLARTWPWRIYVWAVCGVLDFLTWRRKDKNG